VWRTDGEVESIVLQAESDTDFSLCFSSHKLKLCSIAEDADQKCRRRRSEILCRYFPPLKISQSCDAVPMNRSIGSDSQALVREAIKA